MSGLVKKCFFSYSKRDYENSLRGGSANILGEGGRGVGVGCITFCYSIALFLAILKKTDTAFYRMFLKASL